MFSGDTIRLIVEFRDFNGLVINPTNVTLTIYDIDEETIVETITDVLIDGSKFYYDYVSLNKDFIFEFKGEYNSKPILARQLKKVNFIRESGKC